MRPLIQRCLGRPSKHGDNSVALGRCRYDEFNLHNATTFRNVKAFGAVGDGTVDDSNAINRALSHGRNMSAMLTTQPAVVYLPPGTYRVSVTLQMAFYTFIVGNPNCVPTIHWTGSKSAAIGGPVSCYKCEHTNVSSLARCHRQPMCYWALYEHACNLMLSTGC